MTTCFFLDKGLHLCPLYTLKLALINTSILAVSLKELESTLLMAPIDPSAEEEMLPLPKGMSLDKSVFEFPKCQVRFEFTASQL